MITSQDSDNTVKIVTHLLPKLTAEELDYIKQVTTIMLQELDNEEDTHVYKEVQEG